MTAVFIQIPLFLMRWNFNKIIYSTNILKYYCAFSFYITLIYTYIYKSNIYISLIYTLFLKELLKENLAIV